MLKTSFPAVGAFKDARNEHGRVHVIQVWRYGKAPQRRSNAPHKFLSALDRETLCKRLQAGLR